MNCRDMTSTPVCLRRADGTKVSALAFHEFGLDAGAVVLNAATRFTDASGEVLYDPADFDEITVGVCPTDVQCVESQEYTYGLDNTGTRFNDSATYCMVLSDGSTIEWTQTPTAGWSAQLTQWAQEIQAATDLAGLRWFAEPRYVDTAAGGDVTSLDGTIRGPGGTPSGLPGAPSIPVAVALAAGGMSYRYVNIQICPGQPVPVRAFRKTSEIYGDGEFDLTTAGAVQGPIQKFWVCTECGREPVWYLEDAVTLAEAGQIPDCWEPCGTLTNSDGPDDPPCTFEIDVACDNNNSTVQNDFTNTITRRAKICGGEQIAVDYFQEDPDDPAALAPYTLVGNFVDCATGLPLPEPVPVCEDFEIVELFMLDTSRGEPGLRNREWHDTEPSPGTGGSTTEAGRAFREGHDFSLTPDTDNIKTDLAVNDTDNTANELDVQTLEGYFVVDEAIRLQFYGGSEGYQAFELGKCCGPLELLDEAGGFGQEITVDIPAGIHQVRIWNIDTGGTNSSKSVRYSYDGGLSYTNDNTPPGIQMWTSKPKEVCKKVKVCKPSGSMVALLTGESIDPADCYECPLACEPCCPSKGVSAEPSPVVRVRELR